MLIVDKLSDKWWGDVTMASKYASGAMNMNPWYSAAVCYWSIRKVRIEAELDQADDTWHAWRAQGIGSSEVGAITGSSPYSTPQNEWKKKVEAREGNVHKFDNVHTRRGKEWEPVVRDLYQKLTGWALTPICCIHDEYEWARASLDGIRDDHQMLAEIKCPTTKSWWMIKDKQNYHDYWRAQVAYQLWVTGAKLAHVLVYDAEDTSPLRKPGDRLLVFEQTRDAEMEEAMVDKLKVFWGYVERKEPPPKDWYRGESCTWDDVCKVRNGGNSRANW